MSSYRIRRRLYGMDDDKNIRDWAVNHVHATLNHEIV
jgi:hypothetical protein